MRKRHAFLIALLFILFFANNITLLSILEHEREIVIISRVIDGDTVELADGRHLRLANINSPEKSSPLSEEAIYFMKKYENRTVEVEIVEEDQYGRHVARIFAPSYLNHELVSLGLASKAWVYDSERRKFASAEKEAVNRGIGIWQHSPHWGCFDLSIDAEKEVVSIDNLCNLQLEGFYIKDESRKIYKFLNTDSSYIELHSGDGSNTYDTFYWRSSNVWNNDRDSAYIFDKDNKLAGHHHYGY